jgi:hypothetical protein
MVFPEKGRNMKILVKKDGHKNMVSAAREAALF